MEQFKSYLIEMIDDDHRVVRTDEREIVIESRDFDGLGEPRWTTQQVLTPFASNEWVAVKDAYAVIDRLDQRRRRKVV